MTKTLLILDDDEVFASTLQRSFKRRGLAACVALNLEEAKRLIIESRAHYAVVDLKIGNESGLHFLEFIQAHCPDTRALILTGYSSISTAVEAVKLGSVNYLCKPASTDEILKALNEIAPSADAAIAEQPPSVNRLEWEHIQRVLLNNEGNISATAKALGMHRRTLQRKLQKRPVSH